MKKHLLYILASIFLGFTGVAQSILGPSNPNVNQNYTYSYNPGYTLLGGVNWEVTGGTIVSESDAVHPATNNTAVIKFTSAGSKTITVRNGWNNSFITSRNVTAVAALTAGSISGNQTICYNVNASNISNSSSASGGSSGHSYQWQKKTTGSWSNISGATSTSYNPPSLTTTTYYRRRVISGSETKYTNTVTKTVYANLSAGSVSGQIITGTSFCVTASIPTLSSTGVSGGNGSYTRQWQWRSPGGSWSSISGATGTSYTPSASNGSKDYRVRVISCGQTKYTSAKVVSVYPGLSAGSINGAGSFCANESFTLGNASSPSGGDGSIVKQWQWRSPGGSWANISGATGYGYTTSLTTTKEFRRRSISCGETKYTNTVTATVNANLSGGTISGTQEVCLGANPTTAGNTASASGGDGSYSYMWEGRGMLGNPNWTDIGITSLTHNPTAPHIANTVNGVSYELRRRVTSCNQTAYSNIIVIEEEDPVSPGAISGNQEICSGLSAATLTSTSGASGGDGSIDYQWEQKVGSGSWTPISGATSATYAPGTLTTTTEFKRLATSDCGTDTEETSSVTVTVNPDFTEGSVNATFLIGHVFCVTDPIPALTSQGVSGGAGAYTYQWQWRSPGGSWSNISGATGANYTPLATDGDKDYQLLVSSCFAKATNFIEVRTHPALDPGAINGPIQVCQGETFSLGNNTSPVGGDGAIVKQWQSRSPGGSWADVPENGFGYTTSITTDTDFQRKATSCGEETFSNIISVAVYPALDGGIISDNQGICSNGTIAPIQNVTSASGGDGTITYLWQARGALGNPDWADLTITTESHNTPAPPSLVNATSYDLRRMAYSCGQEVPSNIITLTEYPDLIPGIIAGAQAICLGDDPAGLTSSAGASDGDGTYNYQWQSRPPAGTWADITGATNETYDPPATISATTEFQRRVQSCTQTLYTNPITVTVGGTPGTLSGSVSQTGVATGSLQLSGHSGTVLRWESKTTGQWMPITGTAGKTSLSYTNVLETTTYQAVVMSSGCEVLSTEAIVTIASPTMNLGATQSLRPGQSTTLSIDNGSTNYKWYKDGSVVQDGSSNALVVTTPGTYKVEVTGGSSYTTGDAVITDQLQMGRNTVTTYTMRTPISDLNPDLYAYDYTQVQATVGILDGLGRSLQSVAVQQSADGNDMVAPVEYDAFGRRSKSYLPYTDTDKTTIFRPEALATNYANSDHHSYYTASVHSTDKAFAETRFEQSPLNRMLEQGAPGVGWQIGENTVGYSYDFNAANEVINWDYDVLLTGGKVYYAADELTKNTVTDEDGNLKQTFANKVGQTVLNRSMVDGTNWASTYYVYNDFGQLEVVIQPEGVSRLDSEFFGQSTVSRTSFLAKWAFQYEYDDRDRMISKQVPGAEAVYLVYDQWDRLVLTQDGNQRADDEWLFTKYDFLNRPIITGILSSTASEATIRGNVVASSTRFENFDATETNQYSNNSYPTSGVIETLTVTYYDGYGFISHADWSSQSMEFNDPESVQTENTAVKGQVTGTMTKVSDGSWIRGVSYYDDKYRPIQTQSTNHLNGKDVITSYYDFVGQVTKTISSHDDGSETTTIERILTYDHAGRLLEVWHTINSGAPVLVSSNTYSDLGELTEKDLHGGEQSLDYTYNIRGWLTTINDAGLTDGEDDLFGMELFYNQQDGSLTNSQLYNGNISATRWSDLSSVGAGNNRAYTYSYDQLNRLTAANHFENNSSSSNYDVSGLSFDLNGNITALTRNGATGSNIDALAYDYTGNQLQYVDDTSADEEGFDNNSTGTNVDYTYDANGNMISDSNKGITSIDYNHLNLPLKVTFDANNYIEYVYDAAGIKLQQRVYEEGSLLKTTDYVGEFIYEDGVLQLIQHEEGRIVATSGEAVFNRDGSSTNGFTAKANVTITSENNYLKVVTNQATGSPGAWPINGAHAVSDGDTYTFKVKGYSDVGTNAHLYVKADGATNLVWTGAKLPEGSGNEGWVSNAFQIPVGTSFIEVGVLFSGPAIGQTFYISQAELTKVLDEPEYDYQYHLKDHLGNTRLTFSTTPESYTFEEDYEDTASDFSDLKRQLNASANSTTGGSYVSRVQSGETGSLVLISMNKGDTVDLSVQANYPTAPSGNNFLGTAFNTLFTSFDNAFGGAEGVTSTSTEFDDALGGIGMTGKDATSTAPRAFLNYIFFDKDMNYVTAGFQQISTAAQGVGIHELVTIDDVIADREGYLLGYLSNENSEAVNIHFDDFTIYHGKTNVVQSDDYYPFGLAFNSYQRTASTRNFMNTFQDQEYEEETGWVKFKWRNHDPAIGRFFNVDPLSESFYYNSPYAFSENKVISGIELEGLEHVSHTIYNVHQNSQGKYNAKYNTTQLQKNAGDFNGIRNETQYHVYGDDGNVSAIYAGASSTRDLNSAGIEISSFEHRNVSASEIIDGARNNSEFQEAGETLKNVATVAGMAIAGPGLVAQESVIQLAAGASLLNSTDDLSGNFTENGNTVIQNAAGKQNAGLIKGGLGIMGTIVGGTQSIQNIADKDTATGLVNAAGAVLDATSAGGNILDVVEY